MYESPAERPTPGGSASPVDHSFANRQPPPTPDYELLRRIGHGSYGDVWLARSATGTFRAVKIVYRATFASDRPFEREFEGIRKFEPISRLHNSQVDILHVGRNDGCFYYVMELADDKTTGQQIDAAAYSPRTLRNEIARRGSLPWDECLQIGLALTMALENLHEHGLVHRDIKPSNIIFVNGVPKLADIGLVTQADATVSCAGTEGYIPPEGPGTIAADLYSLGKVLYEMSTGKDRQDFPEPATQWDGMPNEQAWREFHEVLLKACEPAVRMRYKSAREMRADLALLQSGKSVKRVHLLEKRLARLTRIGSIVGVIAVLTTAGYFYQQRQTRQVQHLVQAETRQRIRAEEALLKLQIQKADELLRTDDSSAGMACLARLLRNDPSNRLAAQRLFSALSQRAFALPVVGPLQHDKEILYARFSPNGKSVLTASADDTARIWDSDTGRLLVPPLRHEQDVWYAEFSRDGQSVVTASFDGTARVWDAGSGKARTQPLRHEDKVWSAGFSPAGDKVVTASEDGTARIWNASTGEPLSGPLRHAASVNSTQFSPDGKVVLTASDDNTVRIWDAQTGRQTFAPLEHSGPVRCAQFSADGRLIVTASEDGTARLWDAQTGRRLGAPMRHTGFVVSARFSPDNQRIVTASQDRTAKIWDAATSQPIGEPLRHFGYVRFAEFSPDGEKIATVSIDRTARIWSASTGLPLVEPMHLGGERGFDLEDATGRDNPTRAAAQRRGKVRSIQRGWATSNHCFDRPNSAHLGCAFRTRVGATAPPFRTRSCRALQP
ncbi:MAG: hypothetical protein DME19_18505 [Verrucomicrobia bacterium]|nr:MAG: hypothetical protein DME19_18505 [Verrucomicrobiota bacterium]